MLVTFTIKIAGCGVLMPCNWIVNVCLIVNVATLGGGVFIAVYCRKV